MTQKVAPTSHVFAAVMSTPEWVPCTFLMASEEKQGLNRLSWIAANRNSHVLASPLSFFGWRENLEEVDVLANVLKRVKPIKVPADCSWGAICFPCSEGRATHPCWGAGRCRFHLVLDDWSRHPLQLSILPLWQAQLPRSKDVLLPWIISAIQVNVSLHLLVFVLTPAVSLRLVQSRQNLGRSCSDAGQLSSEEKQERQVQRPVWHKRKRWGSNSKPAGTGPCSLLVSNGPLPSGYTMAALCPQLEMRRGLPQSMQHRQDC